MIFVARRECAILEASMTKIAIIEDDPIISQMYRMKFESEGFDVRMADNGQHGVDVVAEFAPDIILLDLQMPHMNGAEALAEIRGHDASKSTPVLILTNLGREEAPAELDTLDVSGYIVKAELTPKQVVARVKSLLETN